MKLDGHDISVCSWSLQPRDAGELIALVHELGLSHVHLEARLLTEKKGGERAAVLSQLSDSDLEFSAAQIGFPGEDFTTLAAIRRTGGFVPDEPWPQRRELAIDAGRQAAELGIDFLSLHAGFIPTSSDPGYGKIVTRVAEVAQALSGDEVSLLLETGQETASELLQFINDLNCRNVGVNFDPANMIMYGSGDPIEAIATLSRHILHVHIKDAVAAAQPRTQWGKEVAFGSGAVKPEALFEALDDIGYAGPLAIEREAGVDRIASVRSALQVLQEYL